MEPWAQWRIEECQGLISMHIKVNGVTFTRKQETLI